jgi:hypothetical protein
MKHVIYSVLNLLYFSLPSQLSDLCIGARAATHRHHGRGHRRPRCGQLDQVWHDAGMQSCCIVCVCRPLFAIRLSVSVFLTKSRKPNHSLSLNSLPTVFSKPRVRIIFSGDADGSHCRAGLQELCPARSVWRARRRSQGHVGCAGK